MIASAHFVCMVLRSEGLEIKPNSISSENILLSRIAPSLPQRLSVSGCTPLLLSHVIRVYSLWYCIASPSAQLFPHTKYVVQPVAIGVAESMWNSKYAFKSFCLFTHALRSAIHSFSGHFTTSNPGIPILTTLTIIVLIVSNSVVLFQDAHLSHFARLCPIHNAIFIIYEMVKNKLYSQRWCS